jgi:hypothetical protein
MNNRKAVVLLITLMFISTISILILKNLSDSEEYIKEVSADLSLLQVKITNENIKDEVLKLTNIYKEDIDEILSVASIPIPFNYGNVISSITLEDYIFRECYLNDIKTNDDLLSKCSTEIIDNISYPYDFIEILNTYKPFKNQKQIDYFIKNYQFKTRDKKIELIKNDFGFIKGITNNTESVSEERYILCKYTISVESIKAIGMFIFKLGSKDIVFQSVNLN